MAEKEESSSKLDTLLERIPVLDGGGRRRLTAGTIVVFTILLVFGVVCGKIVAEVNAKDS